MTIFELLRWAFMVELVKVAGDETGSPSYGGSWGAIESFGELGTMVDDTKYNRYGVMNDKYALGDVHPDALFLGYCVNALKGVQLDVYFEGSPLQDLAKFGNESEAFEDEAVSRLTGDVSELVLRAVILGKLPEFRVETMKQTLVQRNGKPAWFVMDEVYVDGTPLGHETFGFDEKKRRPKAGAYQKKMWSPDPVSIIRSRLDYVLFHTCLNHIEQRFKGFNPQKRLTPMMMDNRAFGIEIALEV